MLSPGDLKRAILAGDLRALCRVPGIGNKSAQKLVLELKDKAGLLALGDAEPETTSPGVANESWHDQVVKGLQGLDWSAKEAGNWSSTKSRYCLLDGMLTILPLRDRKSVV